MIDINTCGAQKNVNVWKDYHRVFQTFSIIRFFSTRTGNIKEYLLENYEMKLCHEIKNSDRNIRLGSLKIISHIIGKKSIT